MGEPEGIVSPEIALRQGDGDIFKGIESPQLLTEGSPAHLLVKVLVDALRRQALRLAVDLSRHSPGVPAVAAGIEIRNARHHLKGAAEAGVDESLVIEPQVQRTGISQQNIACHVADGAHAQIVLTLRGGRAFEAGEELGRGDLHGHAGLLLGNVSRFRAVIPGDLLAALPGQDAPGQVHHMDRIHVTHSGQNHVGGRVKRLVALIERLRGDMGNALHRAGNGGSGGAVLIQCLHHAGVDLPVGVILDHTDLLADDALLLGNTLIRKIGHRHEGEKDLQILLKMLRRVEIVAGHGVGGEGVGLGAVFRQFLQGVALLGVEHLMLEIVGNARRGIQPLAVQPEPGVHAAVARGEKGVLLGVARLGHYTDLQSVGQGLPVNGLTDPLVKALIHSACSFPVRK